MNRFTKKQLLIGGLVLLIVINLAALATFIYQNSKVDNEQSTRTPEFNERREKLGPGMHDNRFSYFLKNRLDLSDKQFEQFREIRRTTSSEQQAIKKQIHSEMDKMMKELASDNPDKEKLKEINGKLGDLHQELNMILIEHFTEIRNICNAEQRKKLNKLIRKIPERRNHSMHQRHMHRKKHIED